MVFPHPPPPAIVIVEAEQADVHAMVDGYWIVLRGSGLIWLGWASSLDDVRSGMVGQPYVSHCIPIVPPPHVQPALLTGEGGGTPPFSLDCQAAGGLSKFVIPMDNTSVRIS